MKINFISVVVKCNSGLIKNITVMMSEDTHKFPVIALFL